MADPEYVKFLEMLLRRGKLKDANIHKILDESNLVEFNKARTHSSWDPIDNHQLYEFLGDVVINEFVAFYIRERYPRVISVKWLTRIKHYAISKKQLAILARAEGLEKHILHKILVPNVMENSIEYMSVLEDIMEAFFGCLVISMKNVGFHHGAAVEVSHNILRSFFDVDDINMEYTVVFDAISRLKELYESKPKPYKWPTTKDQLYKFGKNGNLHVVALYGWPKGNRTVTPENRVVLATATDTDIDRAKQAASAKALKVLDSSYGIQEFPPNPYER